MSATQLKNGVRAWHEELLEFILAHPRASLQEASLFFNVSISWISIVKNTDAFRELWAKRRGEHFSRVSATVSERVTALAEITVDKLTQKVELDPDVSIAQLKEVGDLALKALGFGVSRANNLNINTGPQQNNTFLIDKDTLAQARAAKARLNHESDRASSDAILLPAPAPEKEQGELNL